MGSSFGGAKDKQWFEDEFLIPMGCAGPDSCCADAIGVTYKMILLGLDNAGKTSICLRLMGRGNEIPIRTGMEQVIYDNKMAKERMCNWVMPVRGDDDITLELIDVGGRDIYRHLWAYRYKDVTAVIFVLDACDESRFAEAKSALYEHVLPQVSSASVPLLLILNEKRGSSPLSDDEIMTAIGLICPPESAASCESVQDEGSVGHDSPVSADVQRKQAPVEAPGDDAPEAPRGAAPPWAPRLGPEEAQEKAPGEAAEAAEGAAEQGAEHTDELPEAPASPTEAELLDAAMQANVAAAVCCIWAGQLELPAGEFRRLRMMGRALHQMVPAREMISVLRVRDGDDDGLWKGVNALVDRVTQNVGALKAGDPLLPETEQS